MKDPDAHTGYTVPPLSLPRLAAPITDDRQFAYRKRTSADRQAEHWNQILQGDPIHGPASGFRVGASPIPSQQEDGPRYELIWVSHDEATPRH
jgi:hypothetical protein